MILIWIPLILLAGCIWFSPDSSTAASDSGPYGPAQLVGRIEDPQLVECSGMDISRSTPGLFWAINDGHRSPLLFAVGANGQKLGRVWVRGAENRDWEAIDTFEWQGRPMILIADFGDNYRRYDTHTFYIVDEPKLTGKRFEEPAVTTVIWSITFTYPDSRHDAEGVAVDAINQEILILTKRDNPPILFKVPLIPLDTDQIIVAEKISSLNLPGPERNGLLSKYANQPTALDIADDGFRAVVLTYTDAYLLTRGPEDSWAQALSSKPIRIILPKPHELWELRQREAVFFGHDQKTIFVTSEGKGAGIFRLDIK